MEFRAEGKQAGLSLTRHDGDAGWTQVQADGVGSHPVLGFLIGGATEGELHEVAISLTVGSLCLWARSLATHEPSIFDRVAQPVCHHRIGPVDEGGKPIAIPEQIPHLALSRLGQDTAQPGIVALLLETGEPAPAAPEAHPCQSR